jgi:hypothetical protein
MVSGDGMMAHFAALYSMVFMIGFVGVFELRHERCRLRRLLTSVALMTVDELDLIERIRVACEGE